MRSHETCGWLLKTSLAPDEKPLSCRVTGHLGEFVQGSLTMNGPVALITLPCPALGVTATRLPGDLCLHQPEGTILQYTQLKELLHALNISSSGHFTLHTNAPPGGGAGTSTAALIALARAAAMADNLTAPSAARLAAACIKAEGASDPLMFTHPEKVLWASRQGRVLSNLPPLPPLEVIGGFAGPPQRTDPADNDFPDVSDLIARWPAACHDPLAVAALASDSARRTLARRGPRSDRTEALAASLGAAGFAIAHTGPARALLFPRRQAPKDAEAQLRKSGWRRVLRFEIGGHYD